jgi:hypothetical protein
VARLVLCLRAVTSPGAVSRCLLAAAAGGLLWAAAGPALGADLPRLERRGQRGEAKPMVSLEDFVAALEPLGDWIVHPRWGRAWRPSGVDKYWRPYFHGRWAPTDEGWYWVSDEPWGWATYHFGRWFLDPLGGWTWLPGRRWAPSWVAWRQGKGLVGWAPLGPDGKAFFPTFVYAPAARMLEPVPRVALPLPRSGPALVDTRPVEAAPRAPARPRQPIAVAGP